MNTAVNRIPARNLSRQHPRDLAAAYRRLAYVEAIEALPTPRAQATVEAIIRALAASHGDRPPSPMTVGRWRRRLLDGGGAVNALLPASRAGRASRTPTFPTGNGARAERGKIRLGRPTVPTHVDDIPGRGPASATEHAPDRPRSSHGTPQAAIEPCPRGPGNRLAPSAEAAAGFPPLPAVDSLDCVRVDIAYIGDAFGGPGFLTLAHDRATGRVVAATFGHDVDAAGFMTVLCGIGPDPERTTVIRRGTARPSTIEIDNGVEFHAHSFRGLAAELGITLRIVPVPQIERWFTALRRNLGSPRRFCGARDTAEHLRRWLELHEMEFCREGTRWDRRGRTMSGGCDRGRANPGRD